MITTIEYALFSANVYGNKNEKTAPNDTVRTTQNTLPVPDGWSVLDQQFRSDGFMATAYRRGNEVVISYAGTTDEDSLDWITGNVPAGLYAVLCGNASRHVGMAGANGLAGRCLSLDMRR